MDEGRESPVHPNGIDCVAEQTGEKAAHVESLLAGLPPAILEAMF
jgi:hypothetical protein